MQNEKELRHNEEFIRTTKRRLTDKIVRKLYYRQLSVAMGKWEGICKTKNIQENDSDKSQNNGNDSVEHNTEEVLKLKDKLA